MSELVKQSLTMNPMMQVDTFTHMVNLANNLSAGELLPTHFKKRPSDLLRLCEISARTGISVFALMDECYLVQGKFAYSGKMIAAMVNLSPRIEGSLKYMFINADLPCDQKKHWHDLSIIVSGRLVGEDFEREVIVPWTLGFSDSKGAPERWRNDPQQMLCYYGARVWARRHAPEVIAGLVSVDEIVHDVPVQVTGPIVDKSEVIEVKKEVEPSGAYLDYLSKFDEASNIEDLNSIKVSLQKYKSDELSNDERDKLRKVYQTMMSQFVANGELLKKSDEVSGE